MNYKQLSPVERYQIYALMKAVHDQTQIAKLLDRHTSTISREIASNRGLKSYRPNQAVCLLKLQWSPEQIAGKLPVSYETLYKHVYSDKAQGGKLWKNLRCQKQKRKRYSGGRDRRGQILHRRPLSDRPVHIELRKQVGHWECDTVIGANRKGTIVTMVERKSDFSVIVKVSQKKAELVSRAIIEGLRPNAAIVITLTYDNG